MPDKHQNLIGKRFGQLTVLRDSGRRGQNNAVVWECLCDCGRHSFVTTGSLNSGQTKSCGHPSLEALHKAVAKHVNKTPGTNYALLNDKKPVTNTSGEKNISIVYRHGRKRYRVAITYKKRQHGGLRDTMEEAIVLREELREKYWPNYKSDTGIL